ncbi:hypothetical protein E8E11_010484 [Didymella keratinophila]|nr:hypothetical protein E8E11_010484 [Didymella keratinophila]
MGRGEAFIEVFLCVGLPVIVRWIRGTTYSTGPVWEEAYERRAVYEIRSKIENTQGLGDIDANVEFEIYRPNIADPCDTKEVANMILGPLICHIGSAREIASHVWNSELFDFIVKHATNCINDHTCGRYASRMPDRVIWINPANSNEIRLVEPIDVDAQYVALSYCWGPNGSGTFPTTASSLENAKLASTDLIYRTLL